MCESFHKKRTQRKWKIFVYIENRENFSQD